MQCIAAGVQAAYEEYVRAIKLASEDGKLTDEERTTAQTIAIERATAYARQYGIDLVQTLGSEMLPYFVERVLISIKAKSLPEAVVVSADAALPQFPANGEPVAATTETAST